MGYLTNYYNLGQNKILPDDGDISYPLASMNNKYHPYNIFSSSPIKNQLIRFTDCVQVINSVSFHKHSDSGADYGVRDFLRKWSPGQSIDLRYLIINQPEAWYNNLNPFNFLLDNFDLNTDAWAIP